MEKSTTKGKASLRDCSPKLALPQEGHILAKHESIHEFEGFAIAWKEHELRSCEHQSTQERQSGVEI
eukprot:2083882-Amphidinium_carterae.1